MATNQQHIKDKNNEKSARSRYQSASDPVPANAQVGDLVYLKKDPEENKHKIRQPYLVTNIQGNDRCVIQKMLHSHSEKNTSIQNCIQSDLICVGQIAGPGLMYKIDDR